MNMLPSLQESACRCKIDCQKINKVTRGTYRTATKTYWTNGRNISLMSGSREEIEPPDIEEVVFTMQEVQTTIASFKI